MGKSRRSAKYDKRVRSILIKHGCLESSEIDEALGMARTQNEPLTSVLIKNKFTTERKLLRAISREMKLPPIDLARVRVEEDVLEFLSKDDAEMYSVLPLSRLGDILTLAVHNPFDILKLDDLRLMTGCELRPVLSTEDAINTAIARAYDKSARQMSELYDELVDPDIEDEFEEDPDEEFDPDSSPAVKVVRLIIFQGIKEKCSDIHIEVEEKRIRLRTRIDGVMVEKPAPPKSLHSAIVSRIKILAHLDIAERRVPQDGKFQMKVEGRKVDFRVSTLPTVHGEKVVLRILDSSNLKLSLDSLGFEPKCMSDLQTALNEPWGMILVTGPTGSGKTTTLYSSLQAIITPEENIVTVEDPVEYQIAGINQVPINVKRGLSFAAALRSILRQDPDKIMVGEIRDRETLEIAIKAALTGHLVLSTLHTNDAASTITRMVDMGVDPFMVASTTKVVCAQRLARRLCGCKAAADLPRQRLLEIGFREDELTDEATIYKPKGCNRCKNGYRGRFALLETLAVTDAIQRLILDGAKGLEIKDAGVAEGMLTLRRVGVLNVLKGTTSIEELLRVTAGD